MISWRRKRIWARFPRWILLARAQITLYSPVTRTTAITIAPFHRYFDRWAGNDVNIAGRFVIKAVSLAQQHLRLTRHTRGYFWSSFFVNSVKVEVIRGLACCILGFCMDVFLFDFARGEQHLARVIILLCWLGAEFREEGFIVDGVHYVCCIIYRLVMQMIRRIMRLGGWNDIFGMRFCKCNFVMIFLELGFGKWIWLFEWYYFLGIFKIFGSLKLVVNLLFMI